MIFIGLKDMENITWIRIWSSLILVLLFSGAFAELKINNNYFIMLVPLTYLFMSDAPSLENTSILLIPILFSVASWFPNYRSYIFLKVILYVEYIKLACVFILIITKMTFIRSNYNLPIGEIIFSNLTLFIINKYILSKFNSEEIHSKFKIKNKTELEVNRDLVKMFLVVISIVFTGNILDYYWM